MPSELPTPGVYVQQLNNFDKGVVPASTSVTAFLGRTPKGPLDAPAMVTSLEAFRGMFGDVSTAFPVTTAVQQYFANGGAVALVGRLFQLDAADATNADGDCLSDAVLMGSAEDHSGMYLLDKAGPGGFNLLVIPPQGSLLDSTALEHRELSPAVRQAAATFCAERRAIFLMDPPTAWSGDISSIRPDDLGIKGDAMRNCAVYFPNLLVQTNSDKGGAMPFPPSGAVAGVIAATDVSRGVWKAPAGVNAALTDSTGLTVELTDAENGVLNPLGVNCLRTFPNFGTVVWGARTLAGANAAADDYKYLSVRRLALFLETSVAQSLQWVLFAANCEETWSQVRLQLNSFLLDLARQGAFYAYNVTCDATTTTAEDIAKGVMNVLVAFAPVKPAEFLMLRFQQPTAVGA